MTSLLNYKNQQRTRINYRHIKWTRNVLLSIVFFGVVGIAVFALFSSQNDSSISTHGGVVFSALFIISGGSFLSTFIIGFLFGIPRSTQAENTNPKIGSREGQTSEFKYNDQNKRLQTNTNLQEISDWLTKMIVGIGLTQLYRVPSLLAALSSFLSEGFIDNQAMPTVIASSIVFFGSCGFLSGYLMTRLFLASAFALADELLDAEEYSIKSEELGRNLKNLDNEEVELLKSIFQSNDNGENHLISIADQKNLDILGSLMKKSLVFVSTTEPSQQLGVELTPIVIDNKEKIKKKFLNNSNNSSHIPEKKR